MNIVVVFLERNRSYKAKKSIYTILSATQESLKSNLFIFLFNFSKQQQMRANISGASFPNELRNLLQRRLEDLENQLLKKVNELEEEKSQLYNETVAHRQRTDSTLNSLMNRISELEKGLHKTLFCSLVILLSQVQETRQCCNTFDFNVCNYLALCASKFDNIFPYFSVIVLQFTSWFPLLLIMAVRIIFLNV